MRARRALALCLTTWLPAACGSAASPSPPPSQLFEHDVGVLSISPDGLEMCPLGPGRVGVEINMDDAVGCSAGTGHLGEPSWASPDTPKYAPPCRYRPEVDTTLEFCRVAGDQFGPMTADPDSAQNFYALLKLGKECPPGSVEVRKRLDNEDENNKNSSIGPKGDNEVVGYPVGSYTLLVFCLFRSASSESEVKSAFPDLGVPYAIFHDFDGPQPAWVLSKRWMLSDEDNGVTTTGPGAYSPFEAGEALNVFRKIVETVDANTVFDMARVR